jgi:hypothetical protein
VLLADLQLLELLLQLKDLRTELQNLQLRALRLDGGPEVLDLRLLAATPTPGLWAWAALERAVAIII